MQQLSLFDEILPEGYERVPGVGELYVWTTRWADGDTSPAQLERLAMLCTRRDLSQKIEKTTTGDLIFFRNIHARVEGDHVVVTSRRFETPKMFRKRHDFEDEEEEAIHNGAIDLYAFRKSKQQL
jgi:hypothetical protein